MNCPSCGAAVEAGADLCLECGEPMGDTPAARVVRNESPPAKPAAPATKSVAPEKTPGAGAAAVAKPTAQPIVKKKWRDEEPDPRRCPGCGTKTLAARCPGCGTRLIHDDD